MSNSVVAPPHIHVSEREPGSWTTCFWCSAVELARFCHDTTIAHTLTEAKALRSAAGVPAGPARADQVRTGMLRRYGWNGTVAVGFDALWTALKPVGAAAAVTGSMGAFPAGHSLRRWDPAFAGGHAVFVIHADTGDRVWWCDPLAPTTYQGQWVSKADLKKFVNGMPNAWNIVGQKKVVPVVKTLTVAQVARIAVLEAAIATNLTYISNLQKHGESYAEYTAKVVAYRAEIAAIKATIA